MKHSAQKLAHLSQVLEIGPLWVERTQAEKPLLKTAQPIESSQDAVRVKAWDKAAPHPPKPIQEVPATPLLSWEELEKAVHHCQGCNLSKTRLNTVFGRGSTHAKWLLVGEAPGKNEDEQGLAFVGRAGKLLDNMLKAIGLDSNTDVFMTNVLKCRPPGNRNPEEQEVKACAHFLSAQIANMKPSLIVTLGRFAVQALLGSKESIGALRGKIHGYQGIPLVVTFHPAYLLRNPPEKAKAWQDWVLAMNTLKP